MRRALSLLILALGSVPAVEHAYAAQSEATAADHMTDTLEAEGRAMAKLAGTIRKEVKKGKINLTDAAIGKWDEGSSLWQAALALGKEGKNKQAYDSIRQARDLFGETMNEAFRGTVGKDVSRDYLAWWEIADTRIDHIVTYVKTHEISDSAKERFQLGKSEWEQAKALKAERKYAEAFRKMLSGLNHLDEVMWNTNYGK